MLKKLICLGLCFLLLILPVSAATYSDTDDGVLVQKIIAEGQIISDIDSSLVGADPATLDIKAKSYVLADIQSGKILASSNVDEKMPPASITKIMLLILVMEDLESGKISLDDVVVTSEHANSMGGAQIWLKVGESMSVNDLLKAVFISSANDATVALGEHIAGSEEAAVARMNERAKELGMTNTNFKNTTGLDEPDHYTTAMDITIMSRELLKHNKIFEYTTVWMDTLRDGETQLVNTNKLIRFYKGANGLKTGTTVGAGYCLSASAERDGLKLLSVTLGSETTDDRFLSARRLLDYGFANYESFTPKIDTQTLTPVKVNHGTKETVNLKIPSINSVIIEKGQGKNVTTQINLFDSVDAPIDKDTVLGEIKFLIGDETLATYPITPEESVEKITFWFSFARLFKSFVKMA